MSTRALRNLIAAVAVLLAVTACGGGTGASGDKGGVLRIGTSNGIDSLNPFVGINQDDFAVWLEIYPSLLQYDTTKPGMPYKASLAEAWKFAPDHKTLTFTLRKGAKWSDGTALDANSAAWSLGIMHKFKDGAAAKWGINENIDTITATDPQTLVITFTKPTATTLYALGNTPILPKQVWEKAASGDGKGLKTFVNEPKGDQPMVSGGPFMLTKFVKDDLAMFKPNPNWYGAKPRIDGWGLQTFKNKDALVTALKANEIDAVGGVPVTALSALKSAGITIDEGEGLAMRDLIINSNPDKPTHRELLKADVRKAMEMAIDRKAIVETAWLGKATEGSTIIAPATASDGQKWHNDAIKPLPFDTAQANALLDQAGYAKGPDGVRVADGHKMSYEVIFADDESGEGDRAFQIIQSGFKEVGIALSQKKVDSSAAWDAVYCDDNCQYRDFDLAMWDWFPSADPDFMLAAMTCASWGDWNDTGYCSKEFDALQAQQKDSIDPAARKKIIDQMQQMVYDARPYIILTYDTRLDAWSPKWDGFIPSSQGFFNNFSTQTLEQVHVK